MTETIITQDTSRKNLKKETAQLGDIAIDGNTILRWTLKKYNMKVCNGFIWIRTGSCVHVNEVPASLKGEKCRSAKQLSDSQEGLCSLELYCMLKHFQRL